MITPPGTEPFFIVGSPRSGTTLAGQILDGHSRLAVYQELNLHQTFASCLHLYGDLGDPRCRRRLLGDVVGLLRLQRADAPTVEELEALVATPTLEGVLGAVLRHHAAAQGKPRAGEKTPLNFQYLPRLRRAFPQSPVVFLVRDPRDVALSMQRAWGTPIREAVTTWNRAWLSLREAPPGAVHLVRYEHLVADPEGAIRGICAALGEDFEGGLLDPGGRVPRQFTDIGHRDLATLSGPIVASSVGRHRDMPHADLAAIEAACAGGLRALGYPMLTDPPPGAAPTLDAPGPLRHGLDRLRYYGTSAERWRRGAYRWRLVARLQARRLGHIPRVARRGGAATPG